LSSTCFAVNCFAEEKRVVVWQKPPRFRSGKTAGKDVLRRPPFKPALVDSVFFRAKFEFGASLLFKSLFLENLVSLYENA